MNPELLIVLTIFLAIGISLLFVGALMTLLTAMGNKHYVYGSLLFLFFIVPMFMARRYHWLGALTSVVIPLVLLYCHLHPKQTAYARKLFIPGLIVTVLTGAAGAALYQIYGFSF